MTHYATEDEAIKDWMSIAPQYRTQERLKEMLGGTTKAPLSTDPSAAPTESLLPSSLNNSLPQSLTCVAPEDRP